MHLCNLQTAASCTNRLTFSGINIRYSYNNLRTISPIQIRNGNMAQVRSRLVATYKHFIENCKQDLQRPQRTAEALYYALKSANKKITNGYSSVLFTLIKYWTIRVCIRSVRGFFIAQNKYERANYYV